MDDLDIMLPHYGDSAYLKIAVQSVRAQEDPQWRLTVVDDNPAQRRDEALPAWFAALGDDRIRYLRNPANLGLNANFQHCLELADRELIVIMGADDRLLPNYVRTVRTTFEMFPDVALVQPGVEVIDSSGERSVTLADQVKRRIYAPKITRPRVIGGEDLAVSLLRGNWLYFPSLCWRRRAIEGLGFRERLTVVLDLALVMDVLEQGGELAVQPEVCFQYRRHDASASSSEAATGSRFAEERAYFLGVADRMQQRGWGRAAKAARLHESSRLHAVTLLPAAVRNRHWKGVGDLTRHALSAGRR